MVCVWSSVLNLKLGEGAPAATSKDDNVSPIKPMLAFLILINMFDVRFT